MNISSFNRDKRKKLIKFLFKVKSQSQKKKQNTKIKQQGIQFDQLYIHSDMSFKHLY